jgi:putative ABC transport system substrate-binding protein
MKRQLLTGVALAAAGALALAGCSNGNANSETETAEGAESFNIGINQLVQHEALDAAAQGFKDALSDAGFEVTYDEQNANGEQGTAVTIAQKFAQDDLDLVLAIATPAAQASAQAITDIPVLFTAVTDPVEAGIVADWDAPGANITGVSDLNPVKEQLQLMMDIVPDAKTVGVVYSSGEVNSAVQVEIAQAEAKSLGFEIKETTISNPSELAQAVNSLGDVDAIWVPGDNGVTSAIEVVVQYSEANQIPLFAADAGQVEGGAIATYGLDYYQLGYQTGEMAVKVLTEGADVSIMAVQMPEAETPPLTINLGAAERMGVTIPQELIDSADNIIE